MKNVTVSCTALITKLKSNREKHRAIFLKAQEGFRKRVISDLDLALADARSGKIIRHFIEWNEPVDHTKDYDRVIEMAEMSQDAQVILSDSDFSAFVMDDWEWKRAWVNTNSQYGVKE